MSARFIFSAFADEISPDFDEQLTSLKKLGIPLLELRGVDGKSFVQLTDEEVTAVKEKLQNAGIGLSALGSPIGKIDADGDFDAHRRRSAGLQAHPHVQLLPRKFGSQHL